MAQTLFAFEGQKAMGVLKIQFREGAGAGAAGAGAGGAGAGGAGAGAGAGAGGGAMASVESSTHLVNIVIERMKLTKGLVGSPKATNILRVSMGINLKDRACLVLDIPVKKDQELFQTETADVTAISKFSTAAKDASAFDNTFKTCMSPPPPPPGNFAKTWLSIASEFSKMCGCSKLALEDAANMIDKSQSKQGHLVAMNFSQLPMLQEGKTVYEKYGFRASKSNPAKALENLEILREVRNKHLRDARETYHSSDAQNPETDKESLRDFISNKLKMHYDENSNVASLWSAFNSMSPSFTASEKEIVDFEDKKWELAEKIYKSFLPETMWKKIVDGWIYGHNFILDYEKNLLNPLQPYDTIKIISFVPIDSESEIGLLLKNYKSKQLDVY
jgi:hypothetical protein